MKRIACLLLILSLAGCASARESRHAGYYGIKMDASVAKHFRVRSYSSEGLIFESPKGADSFVNARGYGNGNYLRMEIFNDSLTPINFDYVKDKYELWVENRKYFLEKVTEPSQYPKRLETGQSAEFQLLLTVGGIEKKDVTNIVCHLVDGTQIFLVPVYYEEK